MEIKLKIIIAFILLVSLLIIGYNDVPSDTEKFAQCLTDKGLKMYGSYQCVHCKEQKEMFGDAFNKIDYVECTISQDECINAGIEGLPTWTLADGTLLEGVQSFVELSKASSCGLS